MRANSASLCGHFFVEAFRLIRCQSSISHAEHQAAVVLAKSSAAKLPELCFGISHIRQQLRNIRRANDLPHCAGSVVNLRWAYLRSHSYFSLNLLASASNSVSAEAGLWTPIELSVTSLGIWDQRDADQMGEDQPRSCTVAGTSLGSSTPPLLASTVVQRHVGFSNTRA